MAKQGMKRPQRTHVKPENDAPAVPEIQGKAKSGKAHARPIIAATEAPAQKVYHTKPYAKKDGKQEKPISQAYPTINNDLARDNLENDQTAADLQDL